MTHHTTADYWALPEFIQRVADGNYELLRADSRHTSLHFTRVRRLWSAQVGIDNPALAVDGHDGLV